MTRKGNKAFYKEAQGKSHGHGHGRGGGRPNRIWHGHSLEATWGAQSLQERRRKKGRISLRSLCTKSGNKTIA